MSQFNQDLEKEKILGSYLDLQYEKRGFVFDRIFDSEMQLSGTDLIITHNDKIFNIDEKAQLHYLNIDLPTFTFELSYLNNQNVLRPGWLLDPKKRTDFYFLITGIFLKEPLKSLFTINDIERVKITSVDRKKLIRLLEGKNLGMESLNFYDQSIRSKNYYGKNIISELNPKTQGLIFYSEHLDEKPMNLQLRLSFLLDEKVAKRI